MSGGLRIGVDVGGTNTDAVLMREGEVLATRKSPTTADVSSGIFASIADVLRQASVPTAAIDVTMIGTTHFTNAFVEARNLCRVGVLRLGAPASLAIRPLVDWPARLRDVVHGHTQIIAGGFNYDGRAIAPLSPSDVRRAAGEFRARNLDAIAISSIFAPVNTDQEQEVASLLQEEMPGARIVLSSRIGRIGLIERENAAVMNAALLPMAERVVGSFRRALIDLGLRCPYYISQNDGTLLAPEVVASYPVLTFASGPTNSMRGAALLSGRKDTLVLDIGGTTTDVGMLLQGFPRESAVAVDIGGVRTNFRMPDLLSIGLGGGSLVSSEGGRVRVGPRSVGHRLTVEGRVFGGAQVTATDIAVAAGYAEVGDRDRVAKLDPGFVAAAVEEIHRLAEEALDRIRTSSASVPAVLVGGGNILINRELRGCDSMTVPPKADVANAIGAAIAQVSGVVDRVFSYEKLGREGALAEAKDEAIRQAVAGGGQPGSISITDVEELPLEYLPGAAVRVRVKAVGDLVIARATR